MTVGGNKGSRRSRCPRVRCAPRRSQQTRDKQTANLGVGIKCTEQGVRVGLWEREKREEDRRVEAEELGAEVEEPPFLPTHAFMASAEEE
jgi:hypothetical protein